jgi:ribosomal protein S18 acetylase RimI-like enzyme
MKIRNAKSKDRKKITKLYLELYPRWKKQIKNKTIPLEVKAKKIILIAEDKKDVLGFCWANLIIYGISRFGYIEELFVRKDFRNEGIGTALVKKVMKEMKKLKVAALFVTTERKNKDAIKLYKNLGFRGDGGPWFYWNPKKKK